MPHKTDRENRVIELTENRLDRENHVIELTENQLNTVSGGTGSGIGWNLAKNLKAA